jgi:hypothetical protein
VRRNTCNFLGQSLQARFTTAKEQRKEIPLTESRQQAPMAGLPDAKKDPWRLPMSLLEWHLKEQSMRVAGGLSNALATGAMRTSRPGQTIPVPM